MSPQTFAHDSDVSQDLPGIEQMRGSVRFPLRLPVEVHTDLGVLSTMTEDISSTGVQFSSDGSISPGSIIRWDITLPAAIMGSTGDVKVYCTGRVMWAREVPLEHRFGVVIDSYLLKENEG